ncbi:hypothetical protein T4B_9373 [Trichinella pseudospiralis]|uniref:Uncharacterized protein n=1 Tax=Trichinella pseudospiralis TaxID=6337 RepID=A0A0V1J2N7_TRIPS|nr:hypothetical protein T4B_9373 [Trichinella pseudospiralis]
MKRYMTCLKSKLAGTIPPRDCLVPQSLQCMFTFRPISPLDKDIQDNKKKQQQRNRLKFLLERALINHNATNHQNQLPLSTPLTTVIFLMMKYHTTLFYRSVPKFTRSGGPVSAVPEGYGINGRLVEEIIIGGMFYCIELLFLFLFGCHRISPSVIKASTQTAMTAALAMKRNLTLQLPNLFIEKLKIISIDYDNGSKNDSENIRKEMSNTRNLWFCSSHCKADLY